MDTVDQRTGEIIARPKMPPEIAAGIIKVKKQVRQLGKDEENKFAKFNYVSVDKFYDVIGRMMAEAGLFIVTDEISIAAETREAQTDQGQVKKSVWITATYELTLFHEGGAEYGPIHRTIMVQATGPQAFGSGMSYVEKYFLRSLFKVPTGEQDADAAPQEGVPETRRVTPARTAAPRSVEDEQTKEARDDFVKIKSGLQSAKDLFALEQFMDTMRERMDRVKAKSPEAHKQLNDLYTQRRTAMEQAA